MKRLAKAASQLVSRRTMLLAAFCFTLPASSLAQIGANPLIADPPLDRLIRSNASGVVLALGPGDIPHVLFVQCLSGCATGDPSLASDALYYARWEPPSKTWFTHKIKDRPFGGYSLEVDDNGVVNVALHDGGVFGDWGWLLHLESSNGTTWIETVIDPVGEHWGYTTSIALDSAGQPHVTAKEEQDGSLWYWHRQNGTWSGEIIDSNSNPGRYSSIQIDQTDVPHIAYSTWSPLSEARYAYRVGPGSWNIIVLHTGDTYRRLDLALDRQEDPHVTYHVGNYDLWYARRENGSWIHELIFPGGGKYASLALDSRDLAEVVVHENDLLRAWHLRRLWDGTWEWCFLGEEKTFLGGQSIEIDAAGRAHIGINYLPDEVHEIVR